MTAVSMQLKIVDEIEALVINTDDVRPSFQQIVSLILDNRHYLFDTVYCPWIDNGGNSVLIRYLRVG